MPLSPNLRGSLFMAVSMASFSVNDALAKFLTTQMHFSQVMMLRGAFASVLIGMLVLHQGALRSLRVLLAAPVSLRICGEIGGSALFLVAVSSLPLANVTAIVQSLPLVMTCGAVLILGEPVGWRRWLAIAAGFIGVLIIVRPGADGFSQFTLVALLSVGFYAMRDLVTKQIPAQIPTLFVTFLTAIAVALAGATLTLLHGDWIVPSPSVLGLVALAAVMTLIGFQCGILALRVGDVSAVAPVRYSQMLYAMLLGYAIFGDMPDIAMIVGASVIVVSGIYTFHRERVRNRPLAANASLSPPDGV
ncbi:DMT family transporter [Rhodopseudomonas boonkerdii]|uniref:DMT family transporter n=1 Tax=Rhodopseudomonas boonkerdii TaxID=475937 RepID=UPI001E332272|nr:DMT family transporter [Rhodopseudomonas boonkerdii]UGV27219.1 DMT family transporter [Rhodopseudomonas boonkerdii]